LPASNDNVDIERIKFDAAAKPSGFLGGNERRTGSEKWVEDDVVSFGVQN
jgi:hypothetical protein